MNLNQINKTHTKAFPPSNYANAAHKLSHLTSIMGEIDFEETKIAKQAFNIHQIESQKNTDSEVRALKAQGNIHLGVACIRMIFLIGSIAGASLKAADPLPAGPSTGTLTFTRVPDHKFSEIFTKTLDIAKTALKKIPYEKLPDFANTIGEASKLPEQRHQATIAQAQQEKRRRETLMQIIMQEVNRTHSQEETIRRAYNATAQSYTESMRPVRA